MSIPTNLVDAIASIRDGTIGSQQAMIGDVFISALLAVRHTCRKEITRRPVQAGYSVSIGVIDTPEELEMDIVLANPDYSPEGLITAAITGSLTLLKETWVEKRDQLYATMAAKEIITATSHDQSFAEYVIEEIQPTYDAEDDWDGWQGTVRLVHFGNQGGDTAVDLANAKTAATAYGGAM